MKFPSVVALLAPWARVDSHAGAFVDDIAKIPPLLSASDPWPSGGGTAVSVSLDTARVEGQFTKFHMGINIVDSSGPDVTRAHGARLIKEAGFQFLRFPGGSPADAYLWDGSYDRYPFFKQYKNDYDFGFKTDDFIALCKETGAEPLVQLNYAIFVLYGQEAGTDLAVRWYQHFKDNGVTVKYWELGNENSGGWEVPQSSQDCPYFWPEKCKSTNGAQYGRDLAYVAAALRKLDASVKIGAWVETNEREDGAGQRKALWDSLVMPQLKASASGDGHADWLNIHSYFWQPMDWGKGEYVPYEPSKLYSGDAGLLARTKSDLEGILQKYFPDGTKLPVALTEWNINQAFPHADPQVNQHISALVTADIIGQAVTGGVFALNYFAFTDGWKTQQCDHGPCPGPADLALATWGQPNVPDGTPRPAWLAFAIWHRAMGNTIVHSQSSDGDVTTYASRFASGETGLIVINKRSDDVTLQVSDVPQNAALRGWIVSASDSSASPLDYSRGSAWNGQGPSTSDGSCAPSSIENIKPYSARAVGNSASVFVPKVSVVGIVFYAPDGNITIV
eukprot:TRINITY_DN54644_c0_g1_i1.p1 TRINITY_DN54644_c0_g1~~TRINITY_DN54644_c0_g1_i1.p1  ORF type:complete len:562 (-),score=76.50 TRINITY_DN54644_c0_g1_i1:29-1714(-)